MTRFAIRELICASTVGAAVLFTATAGMAAAPVCLDTRQIDSSKSADDGKSIAFTMKNGAVWKNTLLSPCPDLAFDGFAWVVRGTGQQVCEDVQTLHVLKSGEVCNLGKFTQIKAPTPGKASGF